MTKHLSKIAILGLAFFAAIPQALADGVPHAWGMGMQAPATPVQLWVDKFHDILLYIIFFISIFVLLLLIFVTARYNRATNPKPSKTAHNVKLEIIWTLVPALILVGVAFISFPLLYYSDRAAGTPDLTLKVTGHQWYWSYEYPDHGGVAFDSHGIWDSPQVTDEQAKSLIAEVSSGWLVKGEPMRLLEVDNRVVLPIGKVVRVQVAGADVEHSWFVQSLGVNRMSVPGHLNELWIKVDRPGVFYGQCSMICGNGHAYMPIVVEGVSEDVFEQWIKSKKTAVGENASGAARFAAAIQH
ncbi:MAG: cytochrome c oxidase subunit II [Bdellovibrionales bacterium]